MANGLAYFCTHSKNRFMQVICCENKNALGRKLNPKALIYMLT